KGAGEGGGGGPAARGAGQGPGGGGGHGGAARPGGGHRRVPGAGWGVARLRAPAPLARAGGDVGGRRGRPSRALFRPTGPGRPPRRGGRRRRPPGEGTPTTPGRADEAPSRAG